MSVKQQREQKNVPDDSRNFKVLIQKYLIRSSTRLTHTDKLNNILPHLDESDCKKY